LQIASDAFPNWGRSVLGSNRAEAWDAVERNTTPSGSLQLVERLLNVDHDKRGLMRGQRCHQVWTLNVTHYGVLE
jgi:hypothetical protein